jgi:hypothetical protein
MEKPARVAVGQWWAIDGAPPERIRSVDDPEGHSVTFESGRVFGGRALLRQAACRYLGDGLTPSP